MEVQGFSIKRLQEGGFSSSVSRLDARELEFEEAGQAATTPKLSPGEEQLQYNMSQGILPAEGADAFGRALATGLPQVVVSSMNLDALVRKAGEAMEADAGSGQKFQRPDLDSDYVAPGNDVERTLVGFWEELLGVDQVGVQDSFFDLGGHSLIAVRLFAMIKKAYRVEFPISVLFEAPTIALCAALIRERIGDSGSAADAAPSPANAAGTASQTPLHPPGAHARRRRRRAHPLLPGGRHVRQRAEPAPPGALAGHRSAFLRPAGTRSLWRPGAPHETFEEAATDYIAEMRQVQPHGPYLLGGFSGGGITAFEIARQLEVGR